jgi:hypothetical protein
MPHLSTLTRYRTFAGVILLTLLSGIGIFS